MCDKKELKFSIFILYSLAEKWKMSPPEVYKILDSTGIFDNYVIKCYDVLHTQGKEYLVEDIIDEISKMKGIELRNACDIYYSSKLAEQISNDSFGIENMDAKYLAEDLIENEPELFISGEKNE